MFDGTLPCSELVILFSILELLASSVGSSVALSVFCSCSCELLFCSYDCAMLCDPEVVSDSFSAFQSSSAFNDSPYTLVKKKRKGCGQNRPKGSVFGQQPFR